MKEIADLGSPISPKLSKCSPRFRRKILNIVKKVDIISHDNAEDDEFIDVLTKHELIRKNSLTEMPSISICKKNAHIRAISLQVEIFRIEEKPIKSHFITNFIGESQLLNELKQGQEQNLENKTFQEEKQIISDDYEFEIIHENQKNDNVNKNSEEKHESEQNSAHSIHSDDEATFENSGKTKPRTSLKDELLGFDVNQFNFVDCDNQD